VHVVRPDVEAAAGLSVVAQLLFAAYALVALAAGVLVIAARRSDTAVRALQVSLLAGACAYVQVMAPAVAAVQLVLLAGAAIAALRPVARDEPAPRVQWWWPALALLASAGLALVIVGTWARQYVWTGRELPPGTRFGSAAALAQAWSEAYAPALGAALLALLVAAIAGLAGREHRL
jgi:NADH:ubiquinone oxidoreductase subunit 6 (subunit J)